MQSVFTFIGKKSLKPLTVCHTKLLSCLFFSTSSMKCHPDRPGREPESASVFDSLGSWDNHIDLPLLMEASIKHGRPIPKITAKQIGISTLQGRRTYQEDRIFVENLADDLLCCAVFDGHGGSECSEFCFQNVEPILRRELELNSDLETVLHYFFLQLHDQYMQWVKTHKEGERAGSTATVCLLHGGTELVTGHVGDSRVLLCRSGQARRLTTDHCPSLTTEKARIVQSGGTVTTDSVGRHMVNEALSMSRSIGDFYLKPYGVTSLPDTRTVQIKHNRDSFILLTTDGINFMMRDEECCSLVKQAEDPLVAAQALTEQASSMSSEDNLSAIVVPLGSWGKHSSSASMFYSFGIGRGMVQSSRFG